MNPSIVAHRGFTRDETEDTIAAIEAAITLGCAAVEFDTRVTADGVWVVHHDADLGRIYGVDLEIATSPLAALRDAAPIDTLAEVLALFGSRARPLVEVKETEPRHIEALAAEIRSVAESAPVMILSGELPVPMRELLPETPLFLYEEDWDIAFGRRHEPIDGFDLRHDFVPEAELESQVHRFHEARKKLAVWTVNDRELGTRWLDAGVEWMVTDRPEWWAEA